jgi:hypothetical protein
MALKSSAIPVCCTADSATWPAIGAACARKQKGSNNGAKAARKVAVAHGKVRRAQKQLLHDTSTRLVRVDGIIVIESWRRNGESSCGVPCLRAIWSATGVIW